MKKLILITLCIFPFITSGQFKKAEIGFETKNKNLAKNTCKQDSKEINLSGEAGIYSADERWNRTLYNFSKKHKSSFDFDKIIDEKTDLKISNLKNYYPDEEGKNSKDYPEIGQNFEANLFDGYIPPDNSLAISNNGIIVTVTNSTIEYYNTSGSLLYSSSFDDLFNNSELTSTIYDPVVLYDSGADRFFLVVLHGTSSTTSKVLTCFSKTNNPQDGWWVYHLSGNRLNDGSWFDYPKIGVSNNNAYITGNLFSDADDYNQSIIIQVDKNEGYSGSSMSSITWSNISGDPFTIVPASYGMLGNYGPGIYLISTWGETMSLRLYDISNDLDNSPTLTTYTISNSLTPGGNALQLGSSVQLDCGDPRGLSAFYLDGIIHFVYTSERADGYNGLNYNRLTVSNQSLWTKTFGLEGFDYTYPSVASFGSSVTDKIVAISFLRSGSQIYPQSRVVVCDNDGNWTGSNTVKSGETYVDYLESGNVARWGDYTGISRKQNSSSPEVWVSGCYGKYRSGYHAYNTWIAQITGVVVTDIEKSKEISAKTNIYPNPIYEEFSIEFYLDEKKYIDIYLSDITGKVVKHLFHDLTRTGKNKFTFNKGILKKGVYLLEIKSETQVIDTKKIIIQ